MRASSDSSDCERIQQTPLREWVQKENIGVKCKASLTHQRNVLEIWPQCSLNLLLVLITKATPLDTEVRRRYAGRQLQRGIRRRRVQGDMGRHGWRHGKQLRQGGKQTADHKWEKRMRRHFSRIDMWHFVQCALELGLRRDWDQHGARRPSKKHARKHRLKNPACLRKLFLKK